MNSVCWGIAQMYWTGLKLDGNIAGGTTVSGTISMKSPPFKLVDNTN